jgi:flagellar protein FlgJ
MQLGGSLLSSGSGVLSNSNAINQTISSALADSKAKSIIQSVENLNKLGTGSNKDLKASLEKFEGLLMSQLLGFMYDTVEVDENFGGGFAEEMTRSLMLDQYGAILAKSGGIGIADNIQKQLLRNQAANGFNI